MHRSVSPRRWAFIGATIPGLALLACSSGAERPRTVDSGSSPAATPPVAEAASVGADSNIATPAVDSPAASAKPLPRPTMDPGRKTPKPIVAPSSTLKPKADSAKATTAAPAATGSGDGLKYDAATNTVTFELLAGPFNFNGYTSGGATLLLPPKANVVINFVNKDGTPHSAEVISGEGPVPNAAGDPALPRAYTNKVLEGLPQEAKDVMRFPAPESGSWRIFCGVPGHGLSGMWIWMKVDPSAKTPSFKATKS